MKKLSTKMFPFIIVALSSFLLGAFIIYETTDKPIKKEVITSAEKVFGISFSEAQKDSMLDLLNQRLESYQSIRKIDLNNSIPPAILFNPIPEGAKFKTKQLPFKLSNYSSVKMPKDINDLAYYSVGELGYLLKARKISSVKLTEFFLNRLKKIRTRSTLCYYIYR